MDSINWAYRHTERNIAETGLSLLLELLKNFQVMFCIYTIVLYKKAFLSIGLTGILLSFLKILQMSEFCNQFYRTYFLNIEQEIFAVLTDTFHKPGFKLHVLVLQHLFCLVKFQTLSHNFISFVPFFFLFTKAPSLSFYIVRWIQVG